MASTELVLRKQLDVAAESEERELLEELMASMRTVEAATRRLTEHRARHGSRLPLSNSDVTITSRAVRAFTALMQQ